tara:strand:+ start:1792 stop:2334 length:543 start_codon:yes stop_codon:yes gene_type:complete
MGFAGRRSEKGMMGQRPSILKALYSSLAMAVAWSLPIYLFGFRSIWDLIQDGGSSAGGFLYIPLIMMIAMIIVPPITIFFSIMNGVTDNMVWSWHGATPKNPDDEHALEGDIQTILRKVIIENHGRSEKEEHTHGEHVEATGSILSVEEVHDEEEKLGRLYKEGYLTKEQYERKLERIRS